MARPPSLPPNVLKATHDKVHPPREARVRRWADASGPAALECSDDPTLADRPRLDPVRVGRPDCVRKRGGGGAPAIAQPGADGGGGGGDDVASGPGADAGFTDAFDAGSGPLGDGGAAGALGGRFRHGMNSGHVNPNFTDNDDGLLGTLAGADSNRIKLPQYFLDQWGATVRVDAAKSYVANGMSGLVCFLIGPSASHSTAPAGADAAPSSSTSRKNLYQPIFAIRREREPGQLVGDVRRGDGHDVQAVGPRSGRCGTSPTGRRTRDDDGLGHRGARRRPTSRASTATSSTTSGCSA